MEGDGSCTAEQLVGHFPVRQALPDQGGDDGRWRALFGRPEAIVLPAGRGGPVADAGEDAV